MHIFIAVMISLVVGAVCGYAFRGWIGKEKDYLGQEVGKVKADIGKKL